MNWFATALRVVICFIILTDLTGLFVQFCVDEVIKDRGGLDMRRRMRGKSSSLGIPKAPQVNIEGHLSVQAWGCPGRHPIFVQQVLVCFRFRFVHVICANLGASFAFSFHFYFMHHAGMRQSMVDLQNAHCTSLKSFECGFIECFMCFTYIF